MNYNLHTSSQCAPTVCCCDWCVVSHVRKAVLGQQGETISTFTLVVWHTSPMSPTSQPTQRASSLEWELVILFCLSPHPTPICFTLCLPLLLFPLHSICHRSDHAQEGRSQLLLEKSRPSVSGPLHGHKRGDSSFFAKMALQAVLAIFSPLDERVLATLWAALSFLLLGWKQAPFIQGREGGEYSLQDDGGRQVPWLCKGFRILGLGFSKGRQGDPSLRNHGEGGLALTLSGEKKQGGRQGVEE